MTVIAGIDLGAAAINYTFCDAEGRFLLDRLCDQQDIPVMLMPSGDTAGASGAALDALRHFDETTLQPQ